jgi:KipI family sensor histidine kinase inhibitor
LNSKQAQFNKCYLGISCILYEFSQQLERKSVEDVLALYLYLKDLAALKKLGVVDLVPSYTSLAVYLPARGLSCAEELALDQLIASSLTQTTVLPRLKTHYIPTNYTGDDLDYVLEYHQLSTEQLIELHSAPKYLIAMLGFRPYFPYLLGLDAKLITPRRASPRINTPKGSVAIGGEQTGIYSEDSPGGWHIIGTTKFNQFECFRPGDFIQFIEEK